MNKRGPRIDPCGVTDSIFYHELQEEFIFLYGYVTCSKAIPPYLTGSGKEIAVMGFRNLSKFLKGEEGFFKSSSCKSGK